MSPTLERKTFGLNPKAVMSSIRTFENGSLVSDHSVLCSTSGPETDPAGQARPLPRRPGIVDIWRNLLLLSESKSGRQPHANQKFLKHYEQGDFKGPPGQQPFHIGSGVSFSVVRKELADQPQNAKPLYVAIKTLNSLKRPKHQIEDARLEMELAAGVVLKELRLLTHPPLRNHDNIVKLLGYHSDQTYNKHSTEGGRSDIALVMEYSPHGTHKDFLMLSAYSNVSNDDGLGLSLKVHFMRDITAALKALHDCGVAHGDLKLDNTLVFPDSQRKYIAKLSDFGNSLLDIGDERRRYCGTPSMIAPEVRRSSDDGSLLGASEIMKCEVFSIGLMMWEILLDGHDYRTVIYQDLEDAGDVDLVDALNSLPPDELLLFALICTHECKEEDEALYKVVRDAFRVALREEPEARGSADDVLAALHGRGISLRKDHQVLKRVVNPPEPLPTTTPLALNSARQTRLNYPRLRSLPLIVRDELVLLLGAKASDTNNACHDRYDAKYDLAMCMINGLPTSTVSLESGLRQLEHAAEMGSPDALSILFRIYEALSMQQPEPLHKSSHPLAVVERSLDVADEPMSYMSRRIIACERLYRQEPLRSNFTILHEGKCLVVSRLTDIKSCLVNYQTPFGPEDLECVPCGIILGVRPNKVKLLHLATRLNLRSLVEYLLSTRPNVLPPKQMYGITFLSYEFLSSACEGGHLDMLLWIAQQQFATAVEVDDTLFHWLIKFSTEDVQGAMKFLLMASQKALRACNPGIEFFGARLQGTALEFAIMKDNTPLVRMFLDTIKGGVDYNSLTAIGWTKQTFDTAVSLNLWRLVPMLAPLEKKFRTTRPDLRHEVRYRESQGKSALLPFGLFNIGILNDPTLPFLIHGNSYSEAVEKTLDGVINAGCCSINDDDSNGKTALFHVMDSAIFDYSLTILRKMIAKGARFAPNEVIGEVSDHLFRTKSDRVSREVLHLLLTHNVFQATLDASLLGRSILTGNLDAARMLCELATSDTRLPIQFINQGNSGRPSRLFFTGAMKATKNNVEIVRLILSMGAEKNCNARLLKGDSGLYLVSPLEEAIMEMHFDAGIINLLIEQGAHLSWEGRTVLTAASLRRDFWVNGKHITEHLLRHPQVQALANTEWPAFGTPLTVACRRGNHGAAFALLGAGADLGDDSNVESLCRIASEVAQEPWKLLTDWSNDIGSMDSLRKWRRGMERLLFYLRERRGLIQGRTALHFAVETGNADRIAQLVEENPSIVSQRDDFGRLPVDLLDDKDVPRSDNHQTYFPVTMIRRFLRSSAVRQNSNLRDGSSTASTHSQQMRRTIHFAAIESLGWDSEEVRLRGQPLVSFPRRLLLNEELVRQTGDTIALNQEPSRHQACFDTPLTISDDHGCEFSIVTSQYAKQAEIEFGEDSERGVKARLREIVTSLHKGEMDASRARELLHRISDRSRAIFGAKHPITTCCHIIMMQATCLTGPVEEAVALRQQVLSRLTELHGGANMQSVHALRDIPGLLMNAERYEEAEREALTALERTQDIIGIDPETVAEGYELIAICNMKRGEYESIRSRDRTKGMQWFRKAIDALKSAFEVANKTSDRNRWQALRIMLLKSKIHLYLSEHDQAKVLCKEVLRQDVFSSSKKMSINSITAHRLLSAMNEGPQNLEHQISSQEEILKNICTQDIDSIDESLSLGAAMFDLAQSYVRAGRHPDAVQLVENVLGLWTGTQNECRGNMDRVKALAAEVYSTIEMWEKAEVMQRELLETQGNQRRNIRDKYLLAQSIATSCLKQEKFAAAEQMSRLALSMTAELEEKDRVHKPLAMVRLAEVLVEQRSLDEAGALTRDALKAFQDKGHCENEYGVGRANAILRRIFRTQDRYEDLIICGLEILQSDRDSIDTRIDLMYACQKCGRLDEARSHGAKTKELLDASDHLDCITQAMALYAIAIGYFEIGDYKDSMTVAEEALANCRRFEAGVDRKKVHHTMTGILSVLQSALKHLDMETRLYEVSKELSELSLN